MLYLVCADEFSGIQNQMINVHYGVFSTEQKAKDAIKLLVEKCKEDIFDKFDIIKIPDIDNTVIFKERTPFFKK